MTNISQTRLVDHVYMTIDELRADLERLDESLEEQDQFDSVTACLTRLNEIEQWVNERILRTNRRNDVP